MAASNPRDRKKKIPRSLWIPNFGDSEIYCMSATHRGDMYHVRLAMSLKRHPLVLYDCRDATEQLEQYLDLSHEPDSCHVFRTSWNWNELSGHERPTQTGSGYPLRDGRPMALNLLEKKIDITIISESMATDIIVEAAKAKDRGFQKTFPFSVAHISEGQKEIIDFELGRLAHETFKDLKGSAKKVLLLHRNTGTSHGVYPELDSGNSIFDSIGQIADCVRDRGGTPITCGNPEKIDGVAGIGQYWRNIRQYENQRSRDLEAYFLHKAHSLKLFSLVVGFRSGGLDLCTFLGIPTVSISLNDMVGERRHDKLAIPSLKRYNVKYQSPRHRCTAWVKSRKNDRIVFGSPFWEFGPPPSSALPRQVPDNEEAKREEQKQPPDRFTDFDLRIVEIAIHTAMRKISERKARSFPAFQSYEGNLVHKMIKFTAREARRCWPASCETEEARQKYLEGAKREEEIDLSRRKRDRDMLQDTESMYEAAVDVSKKDFQNSFTRLES